MSKVLSVGYVEERKKFLKLGNPFLETERLSKESNDAFDAWIKAKDAYMNYDQDAEYKKINKALLKLKDAVNNYADLVDHDKQVHNIYH